MSDVDNDWFLFNLFHHLDWTSEQGETLHIKQLIQFAIVTRIRISTLIFYHIQVPDVLYILYLYNIYKELTEESRVLTSIECGILFRLLIFTFLFCIIFFESFPVLREKFSWKQKQFYAVGWGLHLLKNFEGKFKAHNLAEVIFVLNSRDQ